MGPRVGGGDSNRDGHETGGDPMGLMGDDTSAMMLYAGLGLLTFLLLRRHTRRQRQSRRLDKQPLRVLPPQRKDATPLMDAPPELLRWQVEMHETARALQATLDSKMSALGALVRIAREHSDRLRADIARAAQLSVTARPDAMETIEQLAAQSLDADAVSAALRTLPKLQERPAVDSEFLRRITDLADRGENAESIARQTGASIGDVELLPSLRSVAKTDGR